MIKETSSHIYCDDFDIHYYDDGEPPRHKWGRRLLFCLFWTVIIFFVGYLMYGCSPYSKLQKHPPITTKDSSELSQSCVKTFPAKVNTVVVGKPIIKTVTKIDSSSKKALVKQIDSLFSVVSFQDTLLKLIPNIDSLRTAVTDEVLRGCGTFDETTDSIFIPTTITVHSSEDSALIYNLQVSYAAANKLSVSQVQEIEDTKKIMWTSLGSNALLLISLGFAIAKIFKNKTSIV